jgi:hypothetical protein
MLLSVPIETEEGKAKYAILKDLALSDARRQFLEYMQSVPHSGLSADTFRDRLTMAFDIARIPPTLVSSLSDVPEIYLERYIIGFSCGEYVRRIVWERIASLSPEQIPSFFPEDKALRAIEKMAQSDSKSRSELFRNYTQSCAFDWANDRIFGRLVEYALDDLKYSESLLASEMGLSASFLVSWKQPNRWPLPVTRRRFIRTLLKATYTPIPSD